MARRRLIDPGVWYSGHFKRFNNRQRLLWIGLISMSDDEGKFKAEPAVIKSSVFPFDRINPKVISVDLQKIEEEGLIKRYEIDGDVYGRIVKWTKYQKPSHATPSKIPDPSTKPSGASHETLRRSFRLTGDQSSSEQSKEV